MLGLANKKDIEEMIMRFNQWQSEEQGYHNDLAIENKELHSRITALEILLKNLPSQDTTLKSRLEDLELWRAKMHTLLISTTPATKKEKLNSIALAKLGGGKF